eukprot:31497-Pelagococcus_subviridis.AAC.18
MLCRSTERGHRCHQPSRVRCESNRTSRRLETCCAIGSFAPRPLARHCTRARRCVAQDRSVS